MRFLTAWWSNLALLNYAVPGEVLGPWLPPGCVADVSLDGRAYVSLVAFDFLQARVLGVSWPGFRNFPEVNLRAYVRYVASGDRGVVFIRELVPQRFVAAVARWTYNEPYQAVEMTSRVTHEPSRVHEPGGVTHEADRVTHERGRVHVRHEVVVGGTRRFIEVTGDTPATEVARDGVETFFKEHRWGFNRSHLGRLIRYEVVHPTWKCHRIHSYQTDWNFGEAYGQQWAFLNGATPASVVLAEGSAVEVHLWTKAG